MARRRHPSAPESATGHEGPDQMFTAAEQAAMRRALALAATPGVPLGPNPRVGCVLLDDAGETIAEGFHRGAGTAHAEADALTHAGVRRVVFAQPDPNPEAAGGADTLRAAGVEVESGLLPLESALLNRAWTFGVEHGRPFVTWKFAATLDGRSAAADGTSRWVSSPAARVDTHRLRAACDVMLVGTNTVAVDDPLLTVRDELDQPLERQPLRAVMGERDLDSDRRVFNGDAPSVHLRTRDPHSALAELYAADRQHVFLEGGPT